MKAEKHISDTAEERLSVLPVGAVGKVLCVLTHGSMRRRFLDIGLTPGACVKCVGKSPMGNPRAYLIRGKTVAIRNSDAAQITVECIFGGSHANKSAGPHNREGS